MTLNSEYCRSIYGVLPLKARETVAINTAPFLLPSWASKPANHAFPIPGIRNLDLDLPSRSHPDRPAEEPMPTIRYRNYDDRYREMELPPAAPPPSSYRHGPSCVSLPAETAIYPQIFQPSYPYYYPPYLGPSDYGRAGYLPPAMPVSRAAATAQSSYVSYVPAIAKAEAGAQSSYVGYQVPNVGSGVRAQQALPRPVMFFHVVEQSSHSSQSPAATSPYRYPNYRNRAPTPDPSRPRVFLERPMTDPCKPPAQALSQVG